MVSRVSRLIIRFELRIAVTESVRYDVITHLSTFGRSHHLESACPGSDQPSTAGLGRGAFAVICVNIKALYNFFGAGFKRSALVGTQFSLCHLDCYSNIISQYKLINFPSHHKIIHLLQLSERAGDTCHRVPNRRLNFG